MMSEHLDTWLFIPCERHLAYVLSVFFGTLTHRIALQTPFSDLESRRMDYLLLFYHWQLYSVRCFFKQTVFFNCIAFFPPGRDIPPRESKKIGIASAKHIYVSVGIPPVVTELPKASSKSRVRTVHAKGAECSPPRLRKTSVLSSGEEWNKPRIAIL
jgi:hypothetical protein